VPEERVRALGLSGREVEMAVLIARGLANKEIAAELGISPATVRTHIYNLYQKARARSRVELLNRLRS
jgi:DNA-binding CsgD family transcriptional regulator